MLGEELEQGYHASYVLRPNDGDCQQMELLEGRLKANEVVVSEQASSTYGTMPKDQTL